MKQGIVVIFFSILLLMGSAHAQSPKLMQLKSKSVQIHHLRFIQEDGFLEVPENHHNPGAANIRLPVRIIRSPVGSRREPVFYLDGGPGSTNIGTTANSNLLLGHDLVFVGYRGVDGSVVLNNKKMGKAMTGKRFPLLSDASLDAITAVMKGYFDGLEDKGIDLNQYTMMDVIDDLEYTRKCLGYGKINLLGYSYGTRLALIYSMRYPESIHRMVLAGANPPGHFYWYPEKTEQVLNQWDSIFIADGKGSLREAMQKALENMPKRWMWYDLDKEKIRCGTFLALSQNDLAIMVFDAYYRAAAKNDYSGLYMVSLLFNMAMKKITWGDMYAKGASADMHAGFNYRDLLRASDSTTLLGPNVSLLLWGSIGAWDYPLIPEEYRKMRTISTETLVVSGDLDVPTPTDFAREELMPWLTHGEQVILKNFSHGDIQTAQPEGYDHLVTHFFQTGLADTTLFTPEVLSPDPAKKLHRIAKRAFPLIVMLEWIY